jgi:hypothetical protein
MRTRGYERKFVMPIKRLPPHPHLDHLKYQAKDLLRGHAARHPDVAQQIREFHPDFSNASDAEIFKASLILSAAQLTIARAYGFPSWPRLKAHVESPALAARLHLPFEERIDDPAFRRAVDLLDAGDADGLRRHLKQHPKLVHQHVSFEGGNYFRNPTLLEFIAENPIRKGRMPANIVDIATVILDVGADRSAMEEALGLVATGRVPRECGTQIPLIDLLTARGADPNGALQAAIAHGEFEAAEALIQRGAHITLAVAAAGGRIEEFRLLLPKSGGEERHRALAFASQYGHIDIVRMLLDAGQDPSAFNPASAHAHSTPLHQAALAGQEEVVRLLLAHGANPNTKDLLWRGTPADWAQHQGLSSLAAFLRTHEEQSTQQEKAR